MTAIAFFKQSHLKAADEEKEKKPKQQKPFKLNQRHKQELQSPVYVFQF